MKNNDEVDIVHACAADWLVANGYQYQHEKVTPVQGRADFFAWNDSGEYLIMDCKNGVDGLSDSIDQILDYCSQYPFYVLPVLARPHNTITDYTRSVCARRNVEIVSLDCGHLKFWLDDDTISFISMQSAKHHVTFNAMIRHLIAVSPFASGCNLPAFDAEYHYRNDVAPVPH